MSKQTRAMVLRDMQGNYYVLPLELVERARVPETQLRDLEAAVGDVTGYGMEGAVGGGVVNLDGSFLLQEEVEPWPVVEASDEAGFMSAVRMLAATRY